MNSIRTCNEGCNQKIYNIGGIDFDHFIWYMDYTIY